MACPGCGFSAALAHSGHEILDDGTVRPSLDCPECRFHNHIVLLGWTPGD